MMDEIWKDIAGFEGRYQVSTFGNVKSIKSLPSYRSGRPRDGSLLKAQIGKRTGRYMVKLSNGFSVHRSIHRLVAIAFIPNPHNKPQVNHIDGDKLNNHVSNLEWATGSENITHAFRTGLKNQNGGSNPSARIILETNTGIYYDTIEEAAIAFGLSYQQLWFRIGKSNFIYA